MKDPRVRQALYHAVDRTNVVNTVFLGQSAPVNDLWPKGSPGYESRYDADPFNIQKAKDLLTQAGYGNGTPPIEVIIPSIQNSAQQVMQIIQAGAKPAGFNLTLKQLDDTVFTQEFLKGSYPGCYVMAFGFNQSHPDTLPMMNYQVRVPNSCNYDSANYDSLLRKFTSAKTDSERTSLYQQFNQLWDNDMWVFLICSQTFQWLTKSTVGGFAVDDFSRPAMEKVYLG